MTNQIMSNFSIAANSTKKPTRCSSSTPDQPTAVGLTCSYSLVLVLAVFGNSLVINYARTNTRMKSNVFNIFLICMATADILDVLTVAPIHWVYFFYANQWIGGTFGNISCKLIYYLVDVSVFVSVFTLVAITTDRYFAVCRITYKPLSRVKSLVIVACIWAASGLLASIQLHKFKVIEYKGENYCLSYWNFDQEKNHLTSQYEMVIKLALSYGIPLFLMILMYAMIIRHLRKRLRSRVAAQNDNLQKRMAKQNRPLIEMFITLVLIFAVCWLPVHVNHMLIAFDYQTYQCLPTVVPLVFYLLAHANAAINPLLYFIFIDGFRSELKRNAKRLCDCTRKCDDKSSSSLSPVVTFLRPRSARKSRNTYCPNEQPVLPRDQDNQQNPQILPPTQQQSSEMANCVNSNNEIQHLPKEANLNFQGAELTVHSIPGRTLALPKERGLGNKINVVQERRLSYEPIRLSQSLGFTGYENTAFQDDNNFKRSKSSSLQWEFNTFV